MVTYYKTIDDQMTILETWQPGCWIRCVNPTQEEVDCLIADFEIEPEIFPCGNGRRRIFPYRQRRRQYPDYFGQPYSGQAG